MIDSLATRKGRGFALAFYAITWGSVVALLMLGVAAFTHTTEHVYTPMSFYFGMLGGGVVATQAPNVAERWRGRYEPHDRPVMEK